MVKNNKGITLVALMVTVIVLLIITTAGISTTLDRFELNDYKKMKSDLELLEDKVSDYYLKYEGLPMIRLSDGNIEAFSYTEYINGLTNVNQEPAINANDNDIYYIIDLEALGNITLNYGKDYKENLGKDDFYIINEQSHTIYYVKGVKMDGVTYHYIKKDEQISDDVPPTAPKINIITQTLAKFEFEIIPGKDGWTGATVTYVLNQEEKSYKIGEKISVTTDGTYSLQAVCKDQENNESKSEIVNFTIKTPKIGDFIKYDVAYKDMIVKNNQGESYEYTYTNGWRILEYEKTEDGKAKNLKIISTGIPLAYKWLYNGYSYGGLDYSWTKKYKNTQTYTNFVKLSFSPASSYDFNIENAYFVTGLYYDFENFKFKNGSYSDEDNDSTTDEIGRYSYINKNGIVYNEAEITVGQTFKIKNNTIVRNMILPEVNTIRGLSSKDLTKLIDDNGRYIIRINQLGIILEDIDTSSVNSAKYYIASVCHLSGANYNKNQVLSISGNNLDTIAEKTAGMRPVIEFKDEVEIALSDNGEYWNIIE